MKKLQQFVTVIVLTLALALSVSAGDILGPGMIPPPPATQSIVTDGIKTPGASAAGDILAPDVAEFDMVTAAAINLFQSLLSLF